MQAEEGRRREAATVYSGACDSRALFGFVEPETTAFTGWALFTLSNICVVFNSFPSRLIVAEREMEDSLVARRAKRSTAGNRMEAALAEFRVEDLGMDVEEDEDFAIAKGKHHPGACICLCTNFMKFRRRRYLRVRF